MRRAKQQLARSKAWRALEAHQKNRTGCPAGSGTILFFTAARGGGTNRSSNRVELITMKSLARTGYALTAGGCDQPAADGPRRVNK